MTLPRRDTGVESRARLSAGRSDDAVHETVARVLRARGARGTVADVGCGSGRLFRSAADLFSRWIGVDILRYDALPSAIEFLVADLDRGDIPLPDASVDAACAIEVIEHLENPRAFVRELARITRPDGWIVITTPNQLSLLSLVTLAAKGRFSSFQDGDYPAHRSALLEIDLRRIAVECGLSAIDVEYTRWGRMPLTARHYHRTIASWAPQRLSDNIVLVARR